MRNEFIKIRNEIAGYTSANQLNTNFHAVSTLLLDKKVKEPEHQFFILYASIILAIELVEEKEFYIIRNRLINYLDKFIDRIE